MIYKDEINMAYKNKLKNKLFGLLCEFEKDGEWESFLDSILLELSGFPEDEKTINFLSLNYKLSTSRYLSYKYFRKTIFDCMGLVENLGVK